ncbi:hypothetical protein HFO56_23840 [Rhizobium laguerreae]|uniref:hypothetical protein n=1 Tax=Rhizobium laguerreae TaxID=1076926 RepID=UPI001C921B6F|nr:hypothetical protein [Rhizobium laguerreae]MBY3155360.1 hypothetical protein [Rhizobium laguerreae]
MGASIKKDALRNFLRAPAYRRGFRHPGAVSTLGIEKKFQEGKSRVTSLIS